MILFLVKKIDEFEDGDDISSPSMQIRRKLSAEEIPVAHSAYIEIIGFEEGSVGFELNKDEVLIGRSSDCQMALPLFGVSRVHARIFFKNDEYILEDRYSTNGTYVNGVKIVRCILRNNDQIEIGEAKLIFVEEHTLR